MKVVDMHCDTIPGIFYSRRGDEPQDLFSSKFALNINKMKEGDYLLQNFAMFVNTDGVNDPLEACLELIDVFYDELEKNKDHIGLVKSYSDIEENIKSGKMSALISMEEGAPCRGNRAILRDLYRLGVRMMTLTWNHENCLAYPNNPGRFPGGANTVNGLKKKGFEIIEEAEKLGIILDVSHLSDAGFYDIYNNTTKPFVASHSNARAVCPHARNLTDDMIKKLSERGGVMGINYAPEFLMLPDSDGNFKSRVSDMVEHIKYIVKVGGIDCIGLGSDFDGIDGDLELDNCAKLPILENELRKHGFVEGDIEKIFYRNVLRVYKEVLK